MAAGGETGPGLRGLRARVSTLDGCKLEDPLLLPAPRASITVDRMEPGTLALYTSRAWGSFKISGKQILYKDIYTGIVSVSKFAQGTI